MAPDQSTQTIEVAEDWLLIQSAVGDALRVSMTQVAEEPLPGCFALLLLRLAFAEFVRDIARQEANATFRDEAL
jgi:4-hydroxy-3-methylbut-2-en-1-yl diphosphate synthase IspG/GcpE